MGNGPSANQSSSKRRPSEYESRPEPNRKFDSYHLPFLKKKKPSKFPTNFLKSKKSSKDALPILQATSHALSKLASSSDYSTVTKNTTDSGIITKIDTDIDFPDDFCLPHYENTPIKRVSTDKIENDLVEGKQTEYDSCIDDVKPLVDEKVEENIYSSTNHISIQESSSQESLSDDKTNSSDFVDAAEDLQCSSNETKIKEELLTENKTAIEQVVENNSAKKLSIKKKSAISMNVSNVETEKREKDVLNNESLVSAPHGKKELKQQNDDPLLKRKPSNDSQTSKSAECRIATDCQKDLPLIAPVVDRRNKPPGRKMNPAARKVIGPNLREMNQESVGISKSKKMAKVQKRKPATRQEMPAHLTIVNDVKPDLNNKSQQDLNNKSQQHSNNKSQQDLNNKAEVDAFEESANLLTIKLNNNLLKITSPNSRLTNVAGTAEKTLPSSKQDKLERCQQIDATNALLKKADTEPPLLPSKMNKKSVKDNIGSINLVMGHKENGGNAKSFDNLPEKYPESTEIVSSNNQSGDTLHPMYGNLQDCENLARKTVNSFIARDENQSHAKDDIKNVKADIATNKIQYMSGAQSLDEVTKRNTSKPRLTFEANSVLDDLNKKYSMATDELHVMLASSSHEDFLAEFKELLEPVIQKPQYHKSMEEIKRPHSLSNVNLSSSEVDVTLSKNPQMSLPNFEAKPHTSVLKSEAKPQTSFRNSETKPKSSIHNSEVKPEALVHNSEAKPQTSVHNSEAKPQTSVHNSEARSQTLVQNSEVKLVQMPEAKPQAAVENFETKPQALVENSNTTDDDPPLNEEDVRVLNGVQETVDERRRSSSSSCDDANVLEIDTSSSSGSNTSNMAESEWDDDENSRRLYSSANEIKTQLVEDLMRSSEVNLGDFQQFLELDVTISQKYHYLPFEDLLRSNIEAGITIDDLGRSLRVLAKYGLDLMKTEPERNVHSRKILLNQNFLESSCLSMPGFLEILRSFGYEEQGDSLVFTENVDNEPIALAVWVIEILLAAHELNFYHLGIHPHPQLFLPYFATSY